MNAVSDAWKAQRLTPVFQVGESSHEPRCSLRELSGSLAS